MNFITFSQRYRSRLGRLPSYMPVPEAEESTQMPAAVQAERAVSAATEDAPATDRAERGDAPPSLCEILDQSATGRRKMRLWEETMGECIYCGGSITASDYLTGVDSDIEHIIPRALGGTSIFDNLVCSCRLCNREKGELTAIDYMLSKDSATLQAYLKRIRALAAAQTISKEKYINLLLPKRLVVGR